MFFIGSFMAVSLFDYKRLFLYTSITLLVFISAKAGIEFDFLPFIILIFLVHCKGKNLNEASQV